MSAAWASLRVDAQSGRRENPPVGADPQTVLPSEIAQLHAAIDGAAGATETLLADQPPEAEHQELRRQLAALRERVALAHQRKEGPQALRAELATLLCFARTLQADAEKWRAALAERADEIERQNASARAEQERQVLAREDLVKR